MMHRNKRICLFVAAAILVVAVPVFACVTPVFRFALQKWDPDPYTIIVYHLAKEKKPETAPAAPAAEKDENTEEKKPVVRYHPSGELDEDQKKVVEYLKKQGYPNGFCNIRVVEINLASKNVPEIAKKAWESRRTQSLPSMVAYYPVHYRGLGPEAFEIPLEMKWAKKLIDSPARREIFKRMTKGHSAVFVLLESGIQEKDDRAEKVMRSVFKQIPSAKKIPPLYPGGDEWSLPIAFSILRISRNTPGEEVLAEMLLRTEADLHNVEYRFEPMVFPVFGKGRALYTLVGEGINEENVGTACMRLMAACSCEVKHLNPGVDLVVKGNWWEQLEGLLSGEEEPDLPFASGGFSEIKDTPSTQPVSALRTEMRNLMKTATQPAESKEEAASGKKDSGNEPLYRNLAIAAGAVFLGVVVLVVIMRRKQGTE